MSLNNINLSFMINILNNKAPNISLQLNFTVRFMIHPYRAIPERKYKKVSVHCFKYGWRGVCVFQWVHKSLTNVILLLSNFQESHEATQQQFNTFTNLRLQSCLHHIKRSCKYGCSRSC